MATHSLHLVSSGLLQIVVDFFGVFAVFGAAGAHALHLPALGVQAAVDVLDGFFHAEPVDNVLAVQTLANLAEKGQHHVGVLGGQLSLAAAGTGFPGQLVQVGNQVAYHLFVANPQGRRGERDITEYIRPFIREIHIVLEDSCVMPGTPVMPGLTGHLPEYISFRKPGELEQGIPLQHGGKQFRSRDGADNVFAVGHARAVNSKKAAGSTAYILPGAEAQPQPALVVQVFPTVKMPFVRLLKETFRLARHDRASPVFLLHEHILLVDDGIVRQQGNGAP